MLIREETHHYVPHEAGDMRDCQLLRKGQSQRLKGDGTSEPHKTPDVDQHHAEPRNPPCTKQGSTSSAGQ